MTKPFTTSAPLATRLTRFTELPRRTLALWTALPLALLLAMAHGAFAQQAYAPGGPPDPPGSVARLSLIEGAVSFSPADASANGWTPAALNRPLTRGDHLWTGPRARSELHVGSTALRMNAQTSLDFLALDDKLTQLRLAKGSVQLKVRTLFDGQRLEVDTPNLAFVVSVPGVYRLDVNPGDDTTRVVALSGSGVLYGDNGAALNLGQQQQGNFSGTQLTPAAPGPAVQDDFDAWAAARDQREDQSIAAHYVPREIMGYQQLDTYGDWQQDPGYGAVWLPRVVPVNWAPYRAGHWEWIAPWGWTWVDDAPWGFAPFHYGRWTQIGPRWAWVPGQLSPRPVYAPALVAFVGGGSGNGGINWNISIGSGSAPQPGVGWFPLAPGEAFRPAYRASPHYITQINNSIVVNNTVNITNNYRYQYQPTAVTAVSRDDFFQRHPVQGHARDLSLAELGRAQVLVDHNALPPRPELREQGQWPAATALPPAALMLRPVIRSQGERGPDWRTGPERKEQRAARPEANDRNPRPQTVPPAPTPTPTTLPAVPAPAPAVLRALLAPMPQSNATEAQQRARHEQARAQQDQARQQDQQRHQADEAHAQQAQRAQALQQREQEQVQLRQHAELARQQDAQHRQIEAQQRQQVQIQQAQVHRQTELARQQDAQLRQNEAQQRQQVQMQQEQARQQQQQQQQRMIQQEQQKGQAPQHRKPPPADAADGRAPRPEGDRKHNREP